MNECSFGKTYNNNPTKLKAKCETPSWTKKNEKKTSKESLMCLELRNVWTLCTVQNWSSTCS